MEEVNEKTSSIITVNFKDEDDAPVIPTSASYRIDDVASGTEIKADTAMSPLAAAIDIEVTRNENRILNSAKKTEIKLMTVNFECTSLRGATAEYRWRVKNLLKVT